MNRIEFGDSGGFSPAGTLSTTYRKADWLTPGRKVDKVCATSCKIARPGP